MKSYSGRCFLISAKGDGIVDDTIPIQKAFDSGFKDLYAPEGKYKITDTITSRTDCQNFIGAGRGAGGSSGSSLFKKGATQFIWAGSGVKHMFKIDPEDGSIAWGGRIGNFSLHGDLISGVSGILAGSKTANKIYENIEIVGMEDCFILGEAAYACRFYNVGCYEYTGKALIGLGGNHNTLFNGFQINYCVPNGSYTGATGGFDLSTGTGISFLGCDIEAGYAQNFVYLRGTDGVNFSGCYFESRSSLTQQFIRMGDGTDPILGINFNGNTFQGKGFTREAFYFVKVSGLNVQGNHFFGFADWIINNAIIGTNNNFDNNWVSSTPKIFKSIAQGGNNGRGFYKESRIRLGTSITGVTTETTILEITHYHHRPTSSREIEANVIFTTEDATATNTQITCRLQKYIVETGWQYYGNSVVGKVYANAGTRAILLGTLTI